MKFIMYEIRCLDETKNESYIGSTKNIRQRKHEHKTLSHPDCKVLKTKLYNPELLKFDAVHQSYLKEQISLTAYFDH